MARWKYRNDRSGNEDYWLRDQKLPLWSEVEPITAKEADLLFTHNFSDKEGPATLLRDKLRRQWNSKGLFFAIDPRDNSLWCFLGGIERRVPLRALRPGPPVNYEKVPPKISEKNPPFACYKWHNGDWYYTPDDREDFEVGDNDE